MAQKPKCADSETTTDPRANAKRRRYPISRMAMGIVFHRTSRAILALVAICGIVGSPYAAEAAEIKKPDAVVIEVDKAELIDLREQATTVFVANPEIADVQVPGAPNVTKFLIFGKKPGSTTVFALTHSGQVTSYAVTVKRQIDEVASALKKEVPNATIDVTGAPNGITVSGNASSPRDAQRLKLAAGQFVGEKETLNFNVNVTAATQVNLRVRVAEVSRTADKEFGINWSAIFNTGTIALGLLTGRAPLTTVVNAVTGNSTTAFGNFSPSPAPNNFDSVGAGYRSPGGSINVSGLIDALEQEGLVTVLAEPNLTAVSGETATFLSGGEFPVPVPQGLQEITIEWKRFGVSVEFTPVVLDPNRLSIKVRPEVSELTNTGSVVINGTQIPALAVRRAETTVELASGQSFAIAGLFQNNGSNQLQQLPWLGDIPVLGALFRSTRFQHNESELVIIVTPYIVQPASQTSDLRVPTEGLMFASDLERVLLGRLTTAHLAAGAGAASVEAPHLTGAAGFMLER